MVLRFVGTVHLPNNPLAHLGNEFLVWDPQILGKLSTACPGLGEDRWLKEASLGCFSPIGWWRRLGQAAGVLLIYY